VRSRVHEIPDRGRIAEVSLDHDVALARQLGDEAGGEIGGVAVVDRDPVAGRGEGTRRGAADTARGAGDEDSSVHAQQPVTLPIHGSKQVRLELVFDSVQRHGDGWALVERQSRHHDQA